MITFFRNYTLTHVRNKLIAIYILNVLDIFFTLYLKSTGFFMEANPFMAIFIDNTIFTLALKIILPAALVIYIYIRIRKATELQLKNSNYFILAILFIYTCINILHLIWICLFLLH